MEDRPTSRQQFLTDQALQMSIAMPEIIRSMPPPVPLQLFPERRGFVKNESGIMDVLSVDRAIPGNRAWVSGAPVMLKPDGSLDNDTIAASGRYSMQGVFA